MSLLWQLLYPIIIYNMFTVACAMILGPRDRLFSQGIAAAAAMLVLVPVYLRRRKEMPLQPAAGTGRIDGDSAGSRISWLPFLMAGAASGIFFNNLIVITGLDRLLTGYEEVSDIIYASPLWVQLSMSGLLIPATEEMIFRGLGYQALRTRYSAAVSMVVSAFLFGAFHGNLLQAVYAFAVGLVLAWCCEAGGGVWAAYLAHGAANIASILLQYMGIEDNLSGPAFLLETISAGLCLCLVIKGYTVRRGQSRM